MLFQLSCGCSQESIGRKLTNPGPAAACVGPGPFLPLSQPHSPSAHLPSGWPRAQWVAQGPCPPGARSAGPGR